MKNCIKLSIAGVLIFLLLRALLPNYVIPLFISYLFLPFFCKNDNSFFKWLAFYLPFFTIHTLPAIVHLYFNSGIFTNSFALNPLMNVVNVLMPVSILAVLYIQKYKQWGVFIVLVTIISVIPGFFSKPLQILVAGSSFMLVSLFYPFDEQLSPFKKFIRIYLPFFALFSLGWFYEPLFTPRHFDIDRSLVLPVDVIVPIAIWLGLIIKKARRKYVYSTILIVVFGLIGYVGYPNYRTLLFKEYNYKSVPDLMLSTYEGNKIILDDEFDNHISVFNIWSASCGVCIKEMPDYEKLTEKYADNDKVNFYSVYLTHRNDNKELVDRIKKQYRFELYIGDSTFKNTLSVNWVPKMLIAVDRKIVYYGLPEYDNVNHYSAYKIIDKYLED